MSGMKSRDGIEPVLIRWWPEAANALGLARTAMAELIASGEIGSVKIGKRRLVPTEEIRAFVDRKLAEQRGNASPERAQ